MNVLLCYVLYVKEEIIPLSSSLIFSGICTYWHFIKCVGDFFSVINNSSSHIKKETRRKEGREVEVGRKINMQVNH